MPIPVREALFGSGGGNRTLTCSFKDCSHTLCHRINLVPSSGVEPDQPAFAGPVPHSLGEDLVDAVGVEPTSNRI